MWIEKNNEESLDVFLAINFLILENMQYLCKRREIGRDIRN